MILPQHDQLKDWLLARLAVEKLSLGGDVSGLPAYKDAAVLIALVLRPDEVTVLLTRRASHLPAHPGQISFPGGAKEAHDADLAATALRESHEEIGLRPEQVDVLGVLGEYHTSSRFRVTPVVGLVYPELALHPDPAEVDEIFELPASVLLDPARYERRWVERPGVRIKSHFIEHNGYLVWGATAGMLIGFARLLGAKGEPVERDDMVHRP